MVFPAAVEEGEAAVEVGQDKMVVGRWWMVYSKFSYARAKSEH